jgi:hypothetical protein
MKQIEALKIEQARMQERAHVEAELRLRAEKHGI